MKMCLNLQLLHGKVEYFISLRPKMSVKDLTNFTAHCFWSKREVLIFFKPFLNTQRLQTQKQWHMRVQNDEVSGKIGSAERSEMGKQSWFQRRTRGATARSASKIEGAEMFHSVRGALHSQQHMKKGKKNHTICCGRPSSLAGLIGRIPQKNCWFERDKKFPTALGCPCFYGFVCVHVKAVHANRKTVVFQMELLDKFPVEGGQKDPKRRIIPFLPGKS